MPKKLFIPIAKPDLTGNEKKYIDECISSSWISSKGRFIDLFEEQFAEFIGSKYAVSVANGTVALHLALVAIGIKNGDEVIVPDLTFIASANTVYYTGATPVLVDVEKETWNLDSDQIEKLITPRTKAIMPVHLYGHPANMPEILDIAQKYNLLIIEDAAEAHGAEVNLGQKEGKLKWQKVGSIGKAGIFSFYGNKIITTGEGGMVVTDDLNLAKQMRILRDHGQKPDRRYYHEVIGFNYRMTNMQAAVGLAQLERVEKFIERKIQIASYYNYRLQNIAGLSLPPCKNWAKSVYWMYSILIDHPNKLSRDELINGLRIENIETRPFFYPIHMMPPYKTDKKFPVSSYLSEHGINLPSSVTITNEQIDRIVNVIYKLSK